MSLKGRILWRMMGYRGLTEELGLKLSLEAGYPVLLKRRGGGACQRGRSYLVKSYWDQEQPWK